MFVKFIGDFVKAHGIGAKIQIIIFYELDKLKLRAFFK